jgi:hypothetical protein
MSRRSNRRFQVVLESLEGRNLQSTLAIPQEEPAALLLPAVQKVREAAARMSTQQASPSGLHAYHAAVGFFGQ